MAFAADTVPPPVSDPVLQGAAPGPCTATDSPDYVPGIDAAGNPVERADLGAERTPVPGEIMVPLATRSRFGGRQNGYVILDGKKLEPLLNPSACGH